jgi:hypothetical protein
LARLAPPRVSGDAGLCHDGDNQATSQSTDTQKNEATVVKKAANLICWSIQEIRRVANRLAQRRIQPAHIIAWSLWRRAHQAASQKAHIKRTLQL